MAHIDEIAPEVKASGPAEAHRLLTSGDYSRIRLNWNISSDQFFSLAAEFEANDGVKIARDDRGFYLQHT